MQLNEIGRLLLHASRNRKQDVLTPYLKHFADINRTIDRYSGLKSKLFLKDGKDALDLIRFSAFANDLTTVSLAPGGKMKIVYPGPERTLKEFFGIDNIQMNITSDRAHELPIVDGEIQGIPGVFMRNDDFAKKTFEALAPLMLRGRVLIQPDRCILVNKSKNTVGPQDIQLFGVDSDSPFDDWTVTDDRRDNPTISFMQSDELKPGEMNIYDVSFPFLSGIGFYDLAKVLDDEQDHIVKARLALREVLNEANATDADVPTVVNDVLRPKLDSLERRFRTISQSNFLKQGAAILGAVTMGLVAYNTGGLPQVFSGMAGASGAGLFVKQLTDKLEKRADLKEDPLYLLWRLRGIKRHG